RWPSSRRLSGSTVASRTTARSPSRTCRLAAPRPTHAASRPSAPSPVRRPGHRARARVTLLEGLPVSFAVRDCPDRLPVLLAASHAPRGVAERQDRQQVELRRNPEERPHLLQPPEAPPARPDPTP